MSKQELKEIIREVIKEELRKFAAPIIKEIRQGQGAKFITETESPKKIDYTIAKSPNITSTAASMQGKPVLEFLKEFVDPESLRMQSDSYVDPGINVDEISVPSVAKAVKRDYREFMKKMK